MMALITSHWIFRQIQQYIWNGGPAEGHPESSNNQEREIPRMPFLPSRRTDQRCALPGTRDTGDANANSIFFQRLPPDVRRLILIEAFGDRIMHIDFRYVHDRARSSNARGRADCDLPTGADREPSGHQRDGARGWKWYGCVCHRDPEWRVRNRKIAENCVSEPKRDACIDADGDDRTGARVCDSWSGDKPLKCHVGAMGWLGTCRQA